MSVVSLVRNKKGIIGKTIPLGYSSWLEFWEKNNPLDSFLDHHGIFDPEERETVRKKCAAHDCDNDYKVAGHVSGLLGGGEFIVPLCHSCNHRTDEFKMLMDYFFSLEDI